MNLENIEGFVDVEVEIFFENLVNKFKLKSGDMNIDDTLEVDRFKKVVERWITTNVEAIPSNDYN